MSEKICTQRTVVLGSIYIVSLFYVSDIGKDFSKFFSTMPNLRVLFAISWLVQY